MVQFPHFILQTPVASKHPSRQRELLTNAAKYNTCIKKEPILEQNRSNISNLNHELTHELPRGFSYSDLKIILAAIKFCFQINPS